MTLIKSKKTLQSILVCFVIICSCISITATNRIDQHMQPATSTNSETISLTFNFSDPTIVNDNQSIWVYVNETDLNMIIPNKPVLPTNITVLPFEFGTKILNITYTTSKPENIYLNGQLATGAFRNHDAFRIKTVDATVPADEESTTPYPLDWFSYHTGGGLSFGGHQSFCVLRVFPVRYFSEEHYLQFIRHINITINYQKPTEPLHSGQRIYDLLIITPQKYSTALQQLVDHKEQWGIKTRLVSLSEVYDQIYWNGRDKAEKIKYFIMGAIEHWGVTHVLLIGGIRGQSFQWDLPVRYSHVVPAEEQEYAEQSFLSDLYFADVYDSLGEFSSWDSNQNNIFAEWNQTSRDQMDLYPDVYLGRLPCRNIREVRIMVRKIISYEKNRAEESWFNNLLLVAGDSYNDTNHFNEGQLIAEKASTLLPEFSPVKVYASDQDINRRTVNKALNQGAGFAYFCGHGNPMSWTTHFPPDGSEWTTGYTVGDMIYLRNGYKLPISIVGGCHNGQFDVTLQNIVKGIRQNGLQYFSIKPGNIGDFWYSEWSPNCWAWWLTSKIGGGAIATIANTGLGTHGDGDRDRNGIADYLEVLDGWLELRFLELYGMEKSDNLGVNHGETMTNYLHRFYGNNDKMDYKMVQQWELFGDPSLKIGGYL